VPALAAAQNLYGALADADATASTVYLKAGLEPAVLRQRYHDDVEAAGRYLAIVADAADISPHAQDQVRTITELWPQYTELVAEARFNSRQGFPVGARYLHQASDLMRTKILPAATEIYRDASVRLDDNVESGTSATAIVIVSLVAVAIVALLLAVQFFVTRRTRRVLNPALVGATVLVVVVLGAAVAQFLSSQDALSAAQQDGSDTMQLVAAARILTLRASSDESQALIERGTGQSFYDDFDALVPRTETLLSHATADAVPGARSAIRDARSQFDTFVDAHKVIEDADTNGDYDTAVHQSTDEQFARVQALDDSYRHTIAEARDRLESHADDARAGFGALAIGIPLLLLAAIALVLLGLEQRIREYRS